MTAPQTKAATRAIVTGHTRGLGDALAAALLDRGIAVLGVARSLNASLAQRYPHALTEVELDLADTAQFAQWLGSDALRGFLAGASRVVVGSLAVQQPERVLEWVAEFGVERITVALDARQDPQGVWRLPVHGWTETAAATLDQLAVRFASGGLKHLLSTDIARDGMLSGPNAALYAYLQAIAPSLQVQASGGVREIADVAAAKQQGCAGIVLGRALLEGKLDLAEALAC